MESIARNQETKRSSNRKAAGDQRNVDQGSSRARRHTRAHGDEAVPRELRVSYLPAEAMPLMSSDYFLLT